MIMKALDLGSSKIFGSVLRLALPAMTAQFINVLYGIVDRMFVGNIEGIGDLALAGVGVCAPIATLIASFGNWVGLGGAPLFAMLLGENKPERAKKILSNAVLILIVMSVLITAVVLLAVKPLIFTFGGSDRIYPYAYRYLVVYAAGSVFGVMTIGLNQFVIAQGYSGLGMLSVCLGTVTNLILDPILIFTCDMGVTGAAVATVIAQAASLAFIVLVLISKRTKVRISYGGYSTKTIGKILGLGVSPFLIVATDSLVIIALNIVLQQTGGASGDFWITVATIVQAFMSLITLPMLGISTGTQPVISFNYGARNTRLIRKAETFILSLCVGYTALMLLVSFVLARPFVGLFTSDPTIAMQAIEGIRIYMIGIIPLAFQYAFVDCLTALGQPRYAIALSMTRKMGVMLSCTIALPMILGAKAAFYAEPIADIISAIITTCVFLLSFQKILKKRESAGDIVVG